MAAKKKDIPTQIAEKEAYIEKQQQEIRKIEACIQKSQEEIEALKSLEIKAMLKEIELPFNEVVNLLKTMRSTPQPIANSDKEGTA